MNKVISGLLLFAISWAANAIPVVLVTHEVTSNNSGAIVTNLITDGSHVSGIAPASTATWDWDGSTLTGTGFYGATSALGGSPYTLTLVSDQVTDLVIATGGTPGGIASASSYTCVEGTFLPSVGFSGCGGYSFGSNFIDESTTIWSGTSVSQTLGGDDVFFGPIRTLVTFDYGLDGIAGVDGLTAGDLIVIGNGIAVGAPGGEAMTFQVVPIPAAVWLFGSALGLLGWSRRKAA